MNFPRFAPPSASLRAVYLPVEIRYYIYNQLHICDLRNILRINTVEQSITAPLFQTRTKCKPIMASYTKFISKTVKVKLDLQLLTKNRNIGHIKTNGVIESIQCHRLSLGIPVIFVYEHGGNYMIEIFNVKGCQVNHLHIKGLTYEYDKNLRVTTKREDAKVVILRELNRIIKHNNYLLYTIDGPQRSGGN